MESIKQSSSCAARLRFTLGLLGTLLLLSTILLFGFFDAIPQDPAYHDFAPSTLAGFNIPNALNILTNIPFAIVGLQGLHYCMKFPQRFAPWSWRVFFVGTALTSVGSAVYHWSPNDLTLVWDRIPMTIAFMSLLTAFLCEKINPGFDDYLLIPLVVVGISSVFYWQWSDDLRLYGLVQFFPLVALPILILTLPDRYNSAHYLSYALLCYVLAKIFEAFDYETWRLLGISGHAIKHLLAACSAFLLLMLLKNRQLITTKDKSHKLD